MNSTVVEIDVPSLARKETLTTTYRDTEPLSRTTQALIEDEEKYVVGGFLPLPAYIERARGSTLWDADGKAYIDFIAMFSAGSLGQCHPKIVQTMTEAANTITLVNTSVRVADWPGFAKMMCERFQYDKIVGAVTGSEAADTAIKIARKWGRQVKKIPVEKLLVLGVSDNYHGLTTGVWPIMNPDPERDAYGVSDAKLTNLNPSDGTLLRYGHIEDMEKCLEQHHQNVAAIIMECIHGHLPTFEQDANYSRQVALLCKKYGILFISDEVRMGAGKTGKFLCHEWLGSDIKPDMIVVGKAITGGAYPASFVLGTVDVMSLVGAYQCAGTFSYAPIGLALVRTALAIIDDEGLVRRAQDIQEKFMSFTKDWSKQYPFIDFVTARGADLNITLKLDYSNQAVTARRISALSMHKGLLTYPLDGRVRMSVAMTIPEPDLQRGFSILKETMDEIESYVEIAGGVHPHES